MAENQVVNESPQEGQLSEHDQQMVDKVDQNDASVEGLNKTDEEVMLAGKYKSVEELEKAYQSLESKLGEGKEEEPEESSEPAPSVDEAKEVAEGAGIDYTSVEDEYQESGSLSEDTYAMLGDKGIPKSMVDAYIAGQEALQSETLGNIYGEVGGEQEYNDMIGWAQDNLEESQIKAFNSSLSSPDQASFAIKGLHSLYKADQPPTLVKGSTTQARSGGYQSKQEMTRDMSSPQYKRDPAFRADVQRRVVLSNF